MRSSTDTARCVSHSPRARRLGVLPHGAGIYPNLTARENILYFGALQGPDARRARARAPRSW